MVILISVLLILLSALFSGLNLGLMGLSAHELKRKADRGDKDAAKVYKVRRDGNYLLVTLLVGNVAVISVLSIVLEAKFAGVVAALMTTALITLFGEIIPQAIFSRFALKLGAKLAWLVRIIMIIMWPIAAPISGLLDITLGEELPSIFSKTEFTHLIEEHAKHESSGIDQDEVRIATGALTFGDKTVSDIMTPRSVVNSFQERTKITHQTILRIKKGGYSRFPVYGRDIDHVIGILYAKDLLGNTDEKTAGSLCRKDITYVQESRKLDEALELFLSSKQHIFIVVDEFDCYQGVVTLEDIMEEILNHEIVDEYDRYSDLREYARTKSNGRS